MKTLRIIGIVAVAGALLVLGPVGSAMAADSEGTVTTFTLEGGDITLSTPDTAALTNGAPGAGSVNGPLGTLAVSDTRGSTLGWIVSAASSTFVDGAGSVSTGVSYNSGTGTTTSGTVTAGTAGAVTLTTTAAQVAAGTLASGNNTASYTPTLTVALPASALAGSYTGTVTTSVA